MVICTLVSMKSSKRIVVLGNVGNRGSESLFSVLRSMENTALAKNLARAAHKTCFLRVIPGVAFILMLFSIGFHHGLPVCRYLLIDAKSEHQKKQEAIRTVLTASCREKGGSHKVSTNKHSKEL